MNGREFAPADEMPELAVVGVDARGAIRLFNGGSERVTGFARNEVLDRPFLDTLLGSSPEAHRPILAMLLSGKSDEAEIACRLRTRAGLERELSWKFVRLPGRAKADVILVAFGEDLTEERAEARRARAAEKLATLSALGASLAHEIRNPLNGALLHVNVLERLLERRGLAEECKQALGVVEKEIQRLARLVTEFLEFAQPTPPVMTAVPTRLLTSRLSSSLALRLERAKVVLEVNADDVTQLTDQVKLERALEQLLLNAVEASSPGQHVMLRIHQRDQTLVLEVEDHGPGIGKLTSPVFDPFVSTKPRGTGLGLAIVQRIVTDLGGGIGVDSRPGQTIFTMTFPAPSPMRPQ